jgi:hypothetical protein
MKTRTTTLALILMVAILVLASLACQQAGEVLMPAEATERAENIASGPVAELVTAENAEFFTGDKVELISEGTTIPIYSEPAGRAPYVHASHGSTGFVRESVDVEGEIWYRVESTAGNGWIHSEYITGSAEEEIAFEVGDEATLTGVGFMVNLYDEAGSQRVIAQQPKGDNVEVVEVAEIGAETWYYIDAPTGEGWVPSFNLAPLGEE